MTANKMTLESPLECLALSEVDGDLPGLRTVKLSPWGLVESKNGEFILDDEAARDIVAAFADQDVAVPIDREHETIDPPMSGARGAVGWVERVYAEPGRGLFGLVKWSEAGRDLIRSEAFRYISPVFMVTPKDRRARILHSAAITTKPAIPHMERLAASEKLLMERMAMNQGDKTTPDPKLALVSEIAELLGVKASDDLQGLLAAIRDAIKAKMPKEEGEGESQPSKNNPGVASETVTSAERNTPELLAMREENKTLRIKLRERELTEFLSPYVAKGVLSREPNKHVRWNEADYMRMIALAESNPDVAKAWLDERIQLLPKQVRVTDSGPSHGESRERYSIVANAEREFDATPGHQKATNKRAFVNMRLREANLVALTESEAKGYVLVG